jgi:hypothetical protein
MLSAAPIPLEAIMQTAAACNNLQTATTVLNCTDFFAENADGIAALIAAVAKMAADATELPEMNASQAAAVANGGPNITAIKEKFCSSWCAIPLESKWRMCKRGLYMLPPVSAGLSIPANLLRACGVKFGSGPVNGDFLSEIMAWSMFGFSVGELVAIATGSILSMGLTVVGGIFAYKQYRKRAPRIVGGKSDEAKAADAAKDADAEGGKGGVVGFLNPLSSGGVGAINPLTKGGISVVGSIKPEGVDGAAKKAEGGKGGVVGFLNPLSSGGVGAINPLTKGGISVVGSIKPEGVDGAAKKAEGGKVGTKMVNPLLAME